MDATTLLHEVEHVAVMIMAVWGFIKVIMEISKNISSRRDRERKWDEMETTLTKNIQEERDKIYQKYDTKLVEIETKIETNHSDTEAKLQEIAAVLMILTRGQLAALDGLKQQGCNGAVTQAKKELDEFLMNKAVDL